MLMGINRMTRGPLFDDGELAGVIRAYEDALRVLGLADRADPLTEIIARRIIEIVRSGELNPERICERAIAGLAVPAIGS
jgi:hypothetical protein